MYVWDTYNVPHFMTRQDETTSLVSTSNIFVWKRNNFTVLGLIEYFWFMLHVNLKETMFSFMAIWYLPVVKQWCSLICFLWKQGVHCSVHFKHNIFCNSTVLESFLKSMYQYFSFQIIMFFLFDCIKKSLLYWCVLSLFLNYRLTRY